MRLLNRFSLRLRARSVVSVLALGMFAAAGTHGRAAVWLPDGYKIETVGYDNSDVASFTGVHVDMEFDPSGKLWLAEQEGRVWVLNPNSIHW